MKLTVIGCGYLGATHAACMAELGHEVLGVEADLDKVAILNSGRAPFHERDLDGLLAEHTASGRLTFTASCAEAAEFADLHFIAVGTPQRPDGAGYDLTQLFTAVRRLAPRLTAPAVVAVKSTVPVGTAPRVRDLLHAYAPAGDAVEVAWNPEFLRESCAVEDTLRPDRLVLGFPAEHSWAETVLRQCYSEIIEAGTPTITTDWATAELAKGAANSFLATKISFINAMAEVCEASGADVAQLADILGHDIRIGPRGMRPGLGFGGGCLPKDLAGFIARADELDAAAAVGILREAAAVNARRRRRVVDLAREELGTDLRGKRITMWGAAFKPETDDIRDSPALAVAQVLHDLGATVTVTDPEALDNARKLHPELDYAEDPVDAVQDADLLLHLTEWPHYSRIDPQRLTGRAVSSTVIDGRGTLDAHRWSEAGWTVRALGRP
ncbi:UDP-glucose dehydrogenase family protein [Streptomyces spectabilis]|uniref:UDP-glucose 6-dehydrogenase n=1 Tax=Streptomyces spectabilis TaxID=68270 RepID=A0A5P2XG13_STRST|nr:UDP-glucose/GDP-mannose dehydrogenase family protein [Streptomyces spectabilis]MBB5104414.1 UDPglucose 6-dehydrogenase [Streptomyces spectabilis]MCI3905231.1 UDP-glucose/GDP-mannose dehydrogenase family protein [Streptomyces spectabilis]QEV62239.1 UDP-glucose/GDP-mannose dehydrogenase family protein [Streptomyces spectabilis]GGU99819.1 UDP-glucose 6-dehydrogenase [Streptomyces spectabilis]